MVLKQSTNRTIAVFLTSSTDHVTGKTGATLTITASKAGAAFASISPTVTELANGWYSVALTTAHTDTLGDLALHITATGADPVDLLRHVVAYDFGDATALGISRIDAAISSRLASAGYSAPLDATGTRSAIGLASANLDTQLAAIAGYIDTEVSTLLTNVSTVLTRIGTPSSDIATVIAAIKAKTDNLPASPAAVADIPSAATVAAAAAAQVTTDHGSGSYVRNTEPDNTSAASAASNAATLVARLTSTRAGNLDNLDRAISAVLTTGMTESYNADGTAPTPAQALFVIMQRLTEFSIAGTSIAVKKLDGSTTALVLTMDDATSPTSSTRTS